MLCISPAAYNRPMRMCSTHGTETANCTPYCSPYDVPDAPTDGPEEPVNGDEMPPPEILNAAALDGLMRRDNEDESPIIDGGTDDDPATPE